RRKLTLIENKFPCRHRTELDRVHGHEPFFKHLKRSVGAVALAPFGRARASSGARQSKMRAIRPVFAGNPQFRDGQVDGLSQFRKLRTCLNPDPEYARSLRCREESVSASANAERGAFNPPQTFCDRVNLIRSLFSDELQRNVQRLRTHPPSIGRENLDAFQKARDPDANFRVKIDADKYSHLVKTSSYSRARRIISRACCVANWRIRLRSPGKFRSTTCVPSSPASAMYTSPTGLCSLPPLGPATPVIPTP